MAGEWKTYCGDADLTVRGTVVVVTFENERHQRVSIQEEDDAYLLQGIVARRQVVSSIEDLALEVWEKNRHTSRVGFRIDQKKRLLGEAWVPKAGLTGAEFVFSLRRVASECDRYEYILVGKDRE